MPMELTIPFANTGDKEDFSENTSADGDMSLEKGFTTLFELKPEEGGLFILRKKFNQLLYLMSKEIIENKTKANNSVQLTDTQTIDGVKTFTSNPIYTGTQNMGTNALTKKEYVDGLNTQNVKLTDTQTIGGVKTFTSNPIYTGTQNMGTNSLTKKEYVDGISFGLSQTWQDVTATRSAGVTYTNTTGKAISVNVTVTTGSTYLYLVVDGKNISANRNASSSQTLTLSAVVLKDSTYSVTAGSSVSEWNELR